MKLFASAAKGTEPALRDELRELRFRGVRADRGGVHFEGEKRDAYRACLWSRVALRVMTPLATFEAPDEARLYEGVRAVSLEAALSPRQTLVVSAACRSSRLTHTQYLCQLTKDAVVDRIRDRHGARPSVDKRDADVHLFLHLVKDVATLYLDFAGASLHERGFRVREAEAPLRETLAAALVRYSGWDRKSPCFDPVCGSGTLLVEAGLWAKNVAPGLGRESFGFERWAGFDSSEQTAIRELRDEARAAIKAEVPELIGRDIAEGALTTAREAAKRAGVALVLTQGSLADAECLTAGAIVANPPYGKRLERPAELSRDLGRLVDRHMDANVALLMAEDQPIGHTRRRPEPPRQLFNGDIACVVRTWATRGNAPPGTTPKAARER
ncbi:MAG TPA: THUMP domain-containing protein [Polyangiaceae bacterium]|nr:THUMP domain-containing protein [Polyangiaceae bacterium]